MPWKQRSQQLDEQPDAHARACMDDLDGDITRVFELAQVALDLPARLAESAHQPGDGNVARAGGAALAMVIFHQLAGAAPRTVRQVAVVLDARGHLRHIGAAIARRCVPEFWFRWQVAKAQGTKPPGFISGYCGGRGCCAGTEAVT